MGLLRVGLMQTTLDLPDQLLPQAKHRALQEGRTLSELVVIYIRLGLQGRTTAPAPAPSGGVKLNPA